ncbi:hypothetical protein [Paenibacillus sp. PL2-23]|uniref:hypothetical protein n=1 Tax=Paenibacillus sp. PL2-23 TaxID=2100729 RepID=UPI0030F69B08
MKPLEARVRGVVSRDGMPCAEVEVRTDDHNAPVVLAYYSNGGAALVLHEVLRNDADREADWFDNNMHQAFRSLTSGSLNEDEAHSSWQAFGARVIELAGDEITRCLSETKE